MEEKINEQIASSMEFKIMNILDEYKVKDEDRIKIFTNILALVYIKNHGFPFEIFKSMINELMDCYEDTWPIG